jgi:hypothetical protein
MYGGLQAGIGVLCLVACFRSGFVTSALMTLAFLCGGLFTARLTGLAMDGSLSGYTAGGLLFEIVFTGVAIALLRLGDRHPREHDLALE